MKPKEPKVSKPDDESLEIPGYDQPIVTGYASTAQATSSMVMSGSLPPQDSPSGADNLSIGSLFTAFAAMLLF